MGTDEILQRIIQDNHQSRRDVQQRLARLTEVLQSGTIEEYRKAIEEIFNVRDNEGESDEVLGEDGTS